MLVPASGGSGNLKYKVLATSPSGSASRKSKIDSLYATYNTLSAEDKMKTMVLVADSYVYTPANTLGLYNRIAAFSSGAQQGAFVDTIVIDNNASSQAQANMLTSGTTYVDNSAANTSNIYKLCILTAE